MLQFFFFFFSFFFFFGFSSHLVLLGENARARSAKEKKKRAFFSFIQSFYLVFLLIADEQDDVKVDTTAEKEVNIRRETSLSAKETRLHRTDFLLEWKQTEKPFVFLFRNPQNSEDKPRDLLNILHHQLHQPAENVRTPTTRCHAAVQCVAEEIRSSSANHSDRILKCRPTNVSTSTCDLVLPRFGCNDRGIQVDLDYSTADQLDQLIELYSNRASEETIREFYAECQTDFQWTRERLDEYLEQRREVNRIPSLQHLALVALDRWDEQIKSSNPTFDLNDLAELLDEISDDEFDQTPSPTTTSNSNPLVLSDMNQMQISWSMIDRFEDLYGELPDKSVFSANEEGILLPLDDDLSISIYQALQRRLIKSSATEQQQQQTTKPVTNTSMRKENQSVPTPKKKKSSAKPTTHQQQRWLEPPSKVQHTKNVPSFKQIMREEEHAAKCENPKQVIRARTRWMKLVVFSLETSNGLCHWT